MNRYLLGVGLLLLGSSAFTTGMMMLPEDTAKQFLAILQDQAAINSVNSATMQTIGQWLDNAFDIQQYEALSLAQRRPFLHALFPESKEKFFFIGEMRYSIAKERSGAAVLYVYDESGMITPHVLSDATTSSAANLPEPADTVVNLPSAPSIALDRVSRALRATVQSPYFKSSCLALASGIVVYYWTTWTNKGKKERRKLPAKKLAICAAVLVGVGSFSYFDYN